MASRSARVPIANGSARSRKKAKIPDSVWNMDARAGAVTEALEAGAEEKTVQRAATHASPAMTKRYDRTAETAPLAVAEARRKARLPQ